MVFSSLQFLGRPIPLPPHGLPLKSDIVTINANTCQNDNTWLKNQNNKYVGMMKTVNYKSNVCTLTYVRKIINTRRWRRVSHFESNRKHASWIVYPNNNPYCLNLHVYKNKKLEIWDLTQLITLIRSCHLYCTWKLVRCREFRVYEFLA